MVPMPAELSLTQKPPIYFPDTEDFTGVNSTVKPIFFRCTSRVSGFPPQSCTAAATSSLVETSLLSMERMRSPSLSPAFCAGFSMPEAVWISLRPTTSTPAVNILRPKSRPLGITYFGSATVTSAFLMGNIPNAFNVVSYFSVPPPVFSAASAPLSVLDSSRRG